MLMGSDLIVPELEFSKSALQVAEVGDFQLIELFFQGAKQAFNPSVLPGMTGLGALMADAQSSQGECESFGSEACFVVGANDLGFAIGLHGGNQPLQ